ARPSTACAWGPTVPRPNWPKPSRSSATAACRRWRSRPIEGTIPRRRPSGDCMEHRGFAWMVALALSACAGFISPAHADDAPAVIPESLQPAVAAAEATARTLQRLDRAAWLASDALMEDRATRKLRRAVRGWIT